MALLNTAQPCYKAIVTRFVERNGSRQRRKTDKGGGKNRLKSGNGRCIKEGCYSYCQRLDTHGAFGNGTASGQACSSVVSQQRVSDEANKPPSLTVCYFYTRCWWSWWQW